MDQNQQPDIFERAMHLTKVLRYPEQTIFTFWDTDFTYSIASSAKEQSAKLRTGKLRCNKPTIITPETLKETFQGFSNGAVEFALEKYADILSKVKMLGYQFSHELSKVEEYSENAFHLADRILKESKKTDKTTAILISPNDLWEISLVKIMFEVIKKSFKGNVSDLTERGFFRTEQERKKTEIEILFSEAAENRQYIDELAERLKEYNLFEEYEERFFSFFK